MHPFFNVIQHETLFKHNNVFKFTGCRIGCRLKQLEQVRKRSMRKK